MALVNVTASAVIEGAIKKDVWNILSDFKKFSENVKSVDEVCVSRDSDTYGESEWFLIVDGAPLNWVEEDCYNENVHEINFKSVSGDFDCIKGSWKIKDSNCDGVVIFLTFNYDLGIPVIESVIGEILKEKILTHINAMVLAVKSECEKQQYLTHI